MVSFLKLATVVAASVSSVAAFIPVTGVTQAGVQPRYEIRTLQAQQPVQFQMYLQALNVMYTLGTDNGTSYFQIMGIHGGPNVPWDGVQGTAGGYGYCPHSMNLFPTWHRPYTALYEQQLINSARAVALFYPSATRQRYLDAANALRAPFYDWAIAPANGKNALPDILTQQTVSVTTPAGVRTISNPLYSYKFQQQVQDLGTPFSYWPNTLRWPTSSAQNAGSDTNSLINTFNQNRDGLRAGLFQWMVNCRTYLEMSNDNVQNASPGCSTSLESLHNNVHVYFGGSGNPVGHMTAVAASAFDPAFMLHHANVDRLFAIWQVIYPNAYIVAQASPITNFVISQGSVQDGNSPLQPFRNAAGQWWTSNSVRSTTALGYTYPDLQAANGNSNTMKQLMNGLYSSQATGRASKRSLRNRRDLLSSIVPDVLKATNGSTYQYNANIQTSKYKVGSTFNIYFFFGQPTTTDASKYAFDPNMVGSYGVLAGAAMADQNVISTSTVCLSQALLSKVQSGALKDLTPMNVGMWLKSNLNWKVIGPDGSELDPSTIPDFKVTVVQSTLTPIVNVQEFPEFSTYFPIKLATMGKPGGYSGGLI